MDGNIEHELCNNCKKEIPQTNYVMHTMHCARNITLCQNCKEPVPKSSFEEHKKGCERRFVPKKPSPPPTLLEKSSYFQTRKAVEDKKIEARKERYHQRMERLVDSGHSLNDYARPTTDYRSQSSDYRSGRPSTSSSEVGGSSRHNGIVPSNTRPVPSRPKSETAVPPPSSTAANPSPKTEEPKKASNSMLACKFCDLELPKLDLDDHENYCGSRTDKCLECGELVMFKDKQSHMDSNHAYLKSQRRGQNARPAWDSSSERASSSVDSPARRRPAPFASLANIDYDPMPYLPAAYQGPGGSAAKKKDAESYKEMSRRLDCKTEYIRNLLHDSAGITIPLRRNGITPRNHFNHNKDFSLGPAPQPPASRRRNPPTELVIPCEFCGVPVPHEDLIQHETGCRPDLTRYRPRRRSLLLDEEDDYSPPTPSSPEVELPCEFCGDMFPASQLLGHQVRCT